MKTLSFRSGYKLLLSCLFSCIQVILWAQETTNSSKTTTTTTTRTEWYASPWLWIIGGAIFILVLVALMRGNSSSEVTRTTVVRDDR
jgi:hypothetical protein